MNSATRKLFLLIRLCLWIDEEDDGLYVHDWSEWQQYWYKHLEKKEKDRNRKRLERGKNHVNSDNDKEPSPPPTDTKDEEQAVKPKKESSKKKKKSEVPKVKYAENVSMQQSEYDTLVEKYGAQFTQKLIETLDNYKGSSGKTYKSDYRAILMWVVDKCEMWYVACMCHSFGYDLDEIMQMNIDKHLKRYPNGFNAYDANHRKADDV